MFVMGISPGQNGPMWTTGKIYKVLKEDESYYYCRWDNCTSDRELHPQHKGHFSVLPSQKDQEPATVKLSTRISD